MGLVEENNKRGLWWLNYFSNKKWGDLELRQENKQQQPEVNAYYYSFTEEDGQLFCQWSLKYVFLVCLAWYPLNSLALIFLNSTCPSVHLPPEITGKAPFVCPPQMVGADLPGLWGTVPRLAAGLVRMSAVVEWPCLPCSDGLVMSGMERRGHLRRDCKVFAICALNKLFTKSELASSLSYQICLAGSNLFWPHPPLGLFTPYLAFQALCISVTYIYSVVTIYFSRTIPPQWDSHGV